MRQSLDLTQPEKILFFAGVFLILVSWVFRVRLFSKESSDPVLEEFLEGTFPTTFADLLAFRLLIGWNQLTSESKRVSMPFLIVYFLAFGILLVASVPAVIRHFLN